MSGLRIRSGQLGDFAAARPLWLGVSASGNPCREGRTDLWPGEEAITPIFVLRPHGQHPACAEGVLIEQRGTALQLGVGVHDDASESGMRGAHPFATLYNGK